VNARRWHIDWMIVAALALLPLAWYFTTLFTGQCYFDADLLDQYYPWWEYARQSLLHGRFPLWNPHVFGGMPYHVNPDNALFYPLRLPLMFLGFFKGVAILRALDTAVGCVGMYFLLRNFRTLRLPAFLGALMFGYGSYMSYQFVHVTYINTAVWFPWQLLFLHRLMCRPQLRLAIVLALITATAFLGGSMSIFLVGHVALAVVALFRAIELCADRRWATLRQALALLVLAAAGAGALGLVVLAPALQFIHFSTRMQPEIYYPQIHMFSMAPEALRTLLYPYQHLYYGAPYSPTYTITFVHVPYVGLAGGFLVLLNLLSRRHARLLSPAAVILCFSILMAMGTNTAFFPWMYRHVGFFQWFRWPHDYLFMSYAMIAILAASGLDVVWRDPRRYGMRVVALGAIYLIVGCLWMPNRVTAVALAAGALLVLAVAVGRRFVRPSGAWRPTLAAILTAAVLADLLVFSSQYRLTMPRSALSLDRVAQVLAPVRGEVPGGRQGGRCAMAAFAPEYCRDQQDVLFDYIPLAGNLPAEVLARFNPRAWLRRLPPCDLADEAWTREEGYQYSNVRDDVIYYPVNAAMILGDEEMSGYDPFMIERIRVMFRAIPITRLWNLFNVTHVVAPNRLIQDPLDLASATNGLYVYANRDAFPRVMLPRTVRAGLSEAAVLTELASPTFDPRETVLLESPLPGGLPDQAAEPSRSGEREAHVLVNEPERVVATATLSAPGVLVLHGVHYPGWKAFADGRELPILQANYVFRAVVLPAGTHRVEFRYEPAIFRWSAFVSSVAWLAGLAALVAMGIHERRKTKTRHALRNG